MRKLRTPIARGPESNDPEEPDAAGGVSSTAGSATGTPRVRRGSWPPPDVPTPASQDSVRTERSSTMTQSLLKKEVQRRPSIYLMTPSTFDRAQKFAASMRQNDHADVIDGCAGLLTILGRLGWYAFAVMFTFLVTLSVFPVMTSIKSVDPSKGRLFQDLYSSFLLLIFNLGDLLGRTVSMWIAPRLSGSLLAAASVLRIGFVPLLLCCHTGTDGANPLGGIVGTFDNDAAPMCIIAAYSISNGVIASVSILGPSRVSKEHEPLPER